MAVQQIEESDSTPENGLRTTSARLERVRLAVEVIGVYGRVRWLVTRQGEIPAVSVLRRGLREHAPELDDVRLLSGLRLGRAVERILRLLPTDSRCLMRSLVLTGMLARRGVYAKVVIGVRPEPSFAAHAWVEVEGRPLLSADESTYRRLVEI